MMVGKKPGPPVPPRPSAVAVAMARTSRGGSPSSTQNGGRTIVYKSPSFEYKQAKNQSSNTICDTTHDTFHDAKIHIVTDAIKNGNEMKKAEIFIDNENNKNIVNDCSPVPKPRTHQKLKAAPALPTTLPPTLQQPSTIIIKTPALVATAVAATAPTSAPAATAAAVGDFQNAVDDTANMELKNNKKNQNYTSMIGGNNNIPPKFGLADHENCSSNNNKKLMTEILIEKSNKNFRMPLIETKNLNAFKKFASENNLHSPDPGRKLLSRPEPEGGERDVHEKSLNGTGKRVAFHEMLISELTEMRNKDHIVLQKYPRHGSERNLLSPDISPNGTTRARIRTADWIEVSDSGQPELFTSCQISLEDSGMEDEEKLDDASSGVGDSWDSTKDAEERFSMSLPGLPPLPKSLSGLEMKRNDNDHHTNTSSGMLDPPPRGLTMSAMTSSINTTPQPANRKTSTLDTQLAILRREMFGLRQLDLSLLSQLWTLNESIQDFRTMLQEQETLSPPSPSPSNSELNSITSEDENEDDDDNNVNHHNQHLPIEQQIATQRMRARPPPPPKTRPV